MYSRAGQKRHLEAKKKLMINAKDANNKELTARQVNDYILPNIAGSKALTYMNLTFTMGLSLFIGLRLHPSNPFKALAYMNLTFTMVMLEFTSSCSK